MASAAVLVLDDDLAVAQVHARVLQRSGMSVTVITSPLEALRRISTGASFDAVLCDVRMPELDGLEFFRRASLAWPELGKRIVFISGDLAEEHRTFIRKHGLPLAEKPVRNLAALVSLVLSVAPKREEG